MKKCNKCDADLIVGENWLASRKKARDYKCNACRKARQKVYDVEHKEERAAYHAENREEHLAYGKAYHSENREERLACMKVYDAEHKEERAEYRNRNRARVNATVAKRRALKKELTPEMNAAEWAEIEGMYLYNQIMPGKWHVDHVQALNNRGLHHPINLQILSEHDNCSKGDR